VPPYRPAAGIRERRHRAAEVRRELRREFEERFRAAGAAAVSGEV
jgi:hypothetical protein